MKYIHQLIITLVLLISQTIQAQNYTFDKIPEWVKTVRIPNESAISQYDIISGFYLTLADYQVNLEKEAVFTREVLNVVSYSGITNASQLLVSYDTSYQELKIHHLYIWRNGKKIDRTNDLSLEIMNSEYNLHQGIYTGQITAYDILNDIRRDDLIDFAYTLVGDNPIFNGEKYLFYPLEVMNPLDLYTLRILYKKDKDYTFKFNDGDSIDFESSVVDNYKCIEISQSNVKAMEYEEGIPTWLMPYNYFTLSSFNTWFDVNVWAQKVFTLNEEPKLDDVFAEIFVGEETTHDKINKMINYVQDDIRYMGIESGIGSIKPYPPEQVVSQRFGDCKDKSLLLVSLLKKVGIDSAYPVLVNTFMQHEVDKLYPSNQVFNHCIVTFQYNDTTYWVDPSIAEQGGDFRNLFNTDYGKVLIIGKASDSLQIMSPRKTELGNYIVEELTVNSFTEPAVLKITSNRYGFDADQRRTVLQYYNSKDLMDKLTSDLKLLFPVVNKTNDLEITDDIETNKLTTTYMYEVDDFWIDGDLGSNEASKGFWTFKYEPLWLYQYLNVSACEEREYDYALSFPMNFNYRVILNFPKELLTYDDTKVFENEAYFYEEKYEQLSSTSLQIDYTFRTKTNCIKAMNYTAICETKNKIAKALPVIIYFNKK